jgi:hypothetical protein
MNAISNASTQTIIEALYLIIHSLTELSQGEAIALLTATDALVGQGSGAQPIDMPALIRARAALAARLDREHA